MKAAALPQAMQAVHTRDSHAELKAPRAKNDDDESVDAEASSFEGFLRESAVRVVLEEHGRSKQSTNVEAHVAHLLAALSKPVTHETSPLMEVLRKQADAVDIAVGQVAATDFANAKGVEDNDDRETTKAPSEERDRAPLEARADAAVATTAAPIIRHDEAPAAPAVTAPAAVEASEGVTRALAAIDDPASFVGLDRNAAVIVVDGLHIRLTTHDGSVAVSVEGRGSDGVIARTQELKETMDQAGLALQRLTPAGASADAQLDRQGRAVVDVDEDARVDAAADAFFTDLHV